MGVSIRGASNPLLEVVKTNAELNEIYTKLVETN
jgi:hypothetical protein